jgi:BirA family biotin operon repressor/biotin-[acetyl-CoA-carboxylase] ligase
LAAGLAVSEALRKSCALETDIKWPNDILAGERKLCGILAETIETPFARALIVGIGINLTKNAFPKELEQKATSIESEIGKLPDTETVLHTLIDCFAKHYQILQQPRGEKEIVDHWCKHSSYAQGKRIQVTDGSETFAGITRGLESDGALRVETDAGETKTFHAGDVMAVRSG